MDRVDLAVVLLILALACATWSVVAAIRITIALTRMGVRTPPPLLGWLLFRNLHRYREITLHETGRVGPLFRAYVVPIVAALVLAVAALLLRVRW